MVTLDPSRMFYLSSNDQSLDQMTVHVSDPSWDSRLLSFFSTMSGEDDMLPQLAQSQNQSEEYLHPLGKDPVNRFHDHAYEETFCFFMNILDTMFMDAGASYMDFPIIFQRCESQVFVF